MFFNFLLTSKQVTGVSSHICGWFWQSMGFLVVNIHLLKGMNGEVVGLGQIACRISFKFILFKFIMGEVVEFLLCIN